MQLDDLFTNSTIDIREAMSSKLEIYHGIPLLKNNKDYNESIKTSEFSRIIRFHFCNYSELEKSIHQILDIIENCFKNISFTGIVICENKTTLSPSIQFKINPDKISVGRMIRFLASISRIKNLINVDICFLLKNNKFTLIELSEIMSIARKFYNSEDFTENDCVRLRNSMVNIGFFEKWTGFDAYCAISDTQTKLRNIKNEYIYR